MIKYSLFHPTIDKERILKELSVVFDSKFIGQGPRVDEFEKKFNDFLNDYYPSNNNNNNVVMLNSGTAGLHLAYILAGIKEGDEVVTTPLTCSATTHTLLYQRAIPIFADIQLNTLNIDPEDVKKKITRNTRAIVVMHNGGQPCEMDKIMEIAKENNLKVIEDACQAMGGEHNGKKLGTVGDFGVFSLQAIKNLTIGDGGILICKREEDYERAKRLRWFGIDRSSKIKADWQPFNQRAMTFDVDEVGYKYQATDIDASIGIAQLFNLRKNLDIRKHYVSIYRKELEDIPKIILPLFDKGHANWLFQIILNGVDREEFQKALGKRGVETNMVQLDNSMYTVFKKFKTVCPNLEKLDGNYLSLPLHPNLTEDDIRDICKIVKEVIKEL